MIFAALLLVLPGLLSAAKPLTESTFSQVINDVKVMEQTSKAVKPAALSTLFKAPDLLRTGVDSLAELTAADQTVTRIGANTVFSFEPNGRNINLEQGSVLFHSPKGKGGGTIKTRAASAAVLGTTIIVVTTVNGGFKAIVLEGRGQVRLPNGNFRVLQAGQLVFILPGATQFGPVLNVNLGQLIKASRLVNGFQSELPSVEKITEAVNQQVQLIQSGKAEDTGLLVGGFATKKEVAVVESTILEQAITNVVAEAFGTPAHSPLALLPLAVQQAASTDAIISTSILDPNRLFLTPFTFPVGSSLITNSGFVASNISITTPIISLNPYTTAPTNNEFDLTAFGRLAITTNLTLQGRITNSATLFDTSIGGVNGVTIQPGSLVMATNVGDFTIASGASVSFTNVSIVNASPGRLLGIDLIADSTGEAFGDASLSLVGLHASHVEVEARNVNIFSSSIDLGTVGFGSAFLYAKNNLQIDGLDIFGPPGAGVFFQAENMLAVSNFQASIIGGTFTNTAPTISLYSNQVAGASVQVSGNDINANFVEYSLEPGQMVRMVSANDLTVNNLRVFGISGNSLQLQAGNTLNAANWQISNLAFISMQANTINLQNVNFPAGSTVDLKPQTGNLAANANTGQPPIAGHVNMINGVMYNGTLIPSTLGTFTGTIPGTGITVH